MESLYQAASGLHRSKWQQNILQNAEDLSCQASRQNKDYFSKLQVYSPMCWTLMEILTTVTICSCHFSFLKISDTSCLCIHNQNPYEFILNVQSMKFGVWHNVSVRRTHTYHCKGLNNSAESLQGFHILMHEECNSPWIQLWVRFVFWD